MSFTIKEVTEQSGFSMSKNSITKTVEFLIHSEEFLEQAETQTFEDYELELTLDERIMQQQVIPFFRSAAPLFYEFMISPDQAVLLYLTDLEAKQLNWEDWRITATFSIPDDNGQSFGGGGGWTGPSNREMNSQEFTQVSFNCSASYEHRQNGLVMEATRKIGKAGIIANPGFRQPIGSTTAGIDGAEQPVRSFTFEITQYVPPQKLTYEYTRRLSRLVTCLNEFAFFGFAPRSVLCVGCNAMGHLFQNVPLTLQFEVRPNFKIITTGEAKLAPVQDVYIENGDGTRYVNYSEQYDIRVEPEFPPTLIDNSENNLPDGVHSGWSIVSYLYDDQVLEDEKAIVRKPVDRIIYLPEDIQVVDFSEFLL